MKQLPEVDRPIAVGRHGEIIGLELAVGALLPFGLRHVEQVDVRVDRPGKGLEAATARKLEGAVTWPVTA